MIQNSTMIEFYNDIFRNKPDKWASIERDYVAFRLISMCAQEPARMLDVGCGNGHTLAFFRSQWYRTHYIGMDISPVALEIARERLPLPMGEFHEHIPPYLKYDLISIMGVAEHFDDPAAELHRIGEHLAPGGLIYLEVPNCLSYSHNKEEGFRQTHEGSGQHEWHWRRETWEQNIRQAGLEIVKAFVGPNPFWEFIWVLRKEARQ